MQLAKIAQRRAQITIRSRAVVGPAAGIRMYPVLHLEETRMVVHATVAAFHVRLSVKIQIRRPINHRQSLLQLHVPVSARMAGVSARPPSL